jgi:nitroreductase
LEATRCTASCHNEQPWYFIVVTQENPTELNQLLSCLVEANQVWVKHAPVLMIAVAKLNFEKNGNPNCHAFYDVGAAVCTLTIQATSLRLFVHQMGGFEASKTRELYNIPEGYEPITAIAIGYPGDPQTLPEQY